MSKQKSSGESVPPELLEAAIDMWSQSNLAHSLPVTGRSMVPLLREGDQLFVSNENGNYQPGEILVVRYGVEIITHRLVAIRQREDGENLYITKGDNSPHLDPPSSRNDVIGKVISLRRGKRVMSFDTASWDRVNRGIAKFSSSTSNLYPPKAHIQKRQGMSITSLFRMSCYHILNTGLRVFLQIYLFLFGGWKNTKNPDSTSLDQSKKDIS